MALEARRPQGWLPVIVVLGLLALSVIVIPLNEDNTETAPPRRLSRFEILDPDTQARLGAECTAAVLAKLTPERAYVLVVRWPPGDRLSAMHPREGRRSTVCAPGLPLELEPEPLSGALGIERFIAVVSDWPVQLEEAEVWLKGEHDAPDGVELLEQRCRVSRP